jgi:hypothetical protein
MLAYSGGSGCQQGAGWASLGNFQAGFLSCKSRAVETRWPVNRHHPISLSGTQVVIKPCAPGDKIKPFEPVCVGCAGRQRVRLEARVRFAAPDRSDRIAKWVGHEKSKHRTVVRALDGQCHVAWIPDEQLARDSVVVAVRPSGCGKPQLHLNAGPLRPCSVASLPDRESDSREEAGKNNKHESHTVS